MSRDRSADHLRAVAWRSERAFLDARDPWNRLVAQIPAASVFLRHEWFDAAWRWASADAELYIIALLQGDRLVGAAPLVLRQQSGRFAHRRLSFLTVPDTQLCDVIAEPALRTEVLTALLDALQRRADWDVLDLSYLTADAAEEIADLARSRGRPTAVLDQGNNPAITLAGTWEQYYGRRSRRLKKGNNLIANKLKKSSHQFGLEHRTGSQLQEEQATARLMEEVIAISARSWKRDTGLSLDFPGPNAFIRRLSELAVRNGWLSVWRFEVDGQAVAMEYQLHYNGRIHALRSDFDGTAAELSPGTYLNWKMLEQLFETDDRRYLMGPGDNAYKLRWAEEFDPVKRVMIYGNTWRARGKALFDLRLRALLRRARDRWQARQYSTKETL